jgi:hypothetical protein
MAEPIICPVCGESNPADMEFCKNCQSRLLPLTGPLKDEDGPIHPGQIPTKKVTAELEPILPEWLREARKQARQSAEDEPTITGGDKQTKPLTQTPDLLAGLADQNKQGDEDDETPDWLRSITGAPAKKKKNEQDSSQVKWVELGHNEEPGKDVPGSESAGLPWMRGGESAPEKDELTEWFKQAASPAAPSGENLTFTKTEAPAPVQPDRSTPTTPVSSAGEVPVGTKDIQPYERESVKDLTGSALSSDIEIPDWIKKLDAETPSAGQHTESGKDAPSPAFSSDTDIADWIKKLDSGTPLVGQQSESSKETSTPALSSDKDIADWFKKLDSETPPPGQQPSSSKETPSPATMLPDVPDWLKSFDEAAGAGQSGTESGEALPDWLKTAGPSVQETPAGPAPAEPAIVQSQPIPEKNLPLSELPNWVSSLTPIEPRAAEPREPAVPAFQMEAPATSPAEPVSSVSALPTEPPAASPAGPVPAASAFTEIPESSDDVDAIFASMKIPDWLADITPSQPSPEEGLPPAAQAEEPIEPAELPSWVQAMRPVESAMRDSTAGPLDSRLEERGALAGLQGVLPAIPGATAATSKPKSHSIKLDATDQQQAHAALLEQILSAETAPVPMKADSVPRSQRVLRWALSALLIIILGGVIFGKTQIFPLPAQVPNETIAAIQAVEAIPADAPVLVAFDYEPATIGEMEASGASLMDHLLLLKHPRLALISTSPTGAALAERFMTSTLAQRSYQSGAQYVDLGYLPGGLAGVFDFSQNPTAVMPLNADSAEVWNTQVMQGVTHLSDFAAVIVLTDSLESGRVWIEQTELARGNAPLIILSSAQAGPMFVPYVDSGQVKGMIAGLNGAAGAEQANGGLPGFVRRYWDAYSLGLLLVVVVMFLGGLWNLWLGIQDRRVHEAG